MVLVGIEGGIEAGIGENARLCMEEYEDYEVFGFVSI